MRETTDPAMKEERLREIIRDAAGPTGKAVTAFSGGVDSSLLLWECVQTLGKSRTIAVTASAPTSPGLELEEAERFASELGVEHRVVVTGECSDPEFVRNHDDRCYICKRIRYGSLRSLYDSKGAVVLDGSQADDDPSDRPGMRALKELEIRSPLAEAGIGKAEVRYLLSRAGFIDIASKQAQPCLATRVPTGVPITERALEMIGLGESVLHECGLDLFRLRHHNTIARIVTDEAGMKRIVMRAGTREMIVDRLREIGYEHITLDLTEYGKRFP